MHTQEFHHISPTAKLVAFMRTLSDIPYSEQIAAMCDAESVANSFHDGNLTNAKKRAPLVELRFKSLSGILSRFGIHQVLELASGVSPRGLILTEDPNITFMETDLPGILEEKREIVSELLGPKERPNYKFAEANALHPDELQSAATYFGTAPIAIIHEGLVPYLNNDEKHALAASIAGVLRAHPGSVWTTPDIVVREQHGLKAGDVNLARGRIIETTGRSIDANMFENFQEAETFFVNEGFRVERFRQIEFTPNISCPVVDPKIAEQIQNQEIWVMRLAAE